MSKRLILIRHAKSSWDSAFADDHARTLNGRGRASAQAIGNWLADQGYIPQTVLCSDAVRTQETAARILPQLSPEPKLKLSGMLYHAAPDTILDLVKRETADSIAVIAHNPGIGMAANALVGTPPNHPRFSDYPTCATAVIDFDTDIQAGRGTCIEFTVPRDLIGTSNGDIE